MQMKKSSKLNTGQRQFQRKSETFVCELCHEEVVGSGYTNHCPQCLYSKHVDINPGDRLESCQGLMVPIAIKLKGGQPVSVVHRCQQCGIERSNKLSEQDSSEQIIKIAGGLNQ